ncbi:hypothetical protein BX666DRAFT_1909141 [Dichotomocladium elegans]|nr:hypothetical protein BX666DRAFT_1909141 [Dichotomocladium elegans]
MKYISISRALYDYTAQSDEELTFKEDDILYILDKDEDPDWWKAQLKAPSLVEAGPIGLVPANYLQETEPIGTVEALYDYTAQQDEELSFKENDIMTLYENDDPDWFLVKNKAGSIGLIPSNYIQEVVDQAKVPSPIQQPPVAGLSAPSVQSDALSSWQVCEYDAEKKTVKNKGNLLVGNGMLCYGSETDKSSPVRQFPISDVFRYSMDDRNVHLEVSDTAGTSFDFQAASSLDAKAIISKIGESQSLANTNSLREQNVHDPAIASHDTRTDPEHKRDASACEPRWAIALYTFNAEGAEEISMKESDQVLVIDYISSEEWWTIEYEDGRSGIVPATYVKFQEDYEAEEKEAERRRIENEAAILQRRCEEEEQERRREQEERARLAEVERQRRQEAEARQRDMEAKRREQETRLQPAAITTGSASPRRSQIPAPPPPVKPTGVNHSGTSMKAIKSVPISDNYSPPERTKQPQEPGKPDPSKVRTWTDRTGAFKVEAQFIGCNNDKIRLHKINGVKIDVPVQKMCTDDLRYIEQETGQKLLEDSADDVPLAHLTNKSSRNKQGWDWYEYFMKANVPMHNSLRYASAFQAEGLGEHDLDSLTHRKMKSLGMSETHVQRLQRFIETGISEPASDEELPVSRKIKKKVSFGATSIIDDSDDESVGPMNGRMVSQIQDDERYARQLQEEYNQEAQSQAYSISHPEIQHSPPHGHGVGLRRRGTGRPTPNNIAPRDVNSAMMDKIKSQLSSEPLKPSPVTPPPPPRNNTTSPALVPASVTPAPAEQPAMTHSTGFADDAWAPRAPGSANTSTDHTSALAQTKAAWSVPPPVPQLSAIPPGQNVASQIQPAQAAAALTPPLASAPAPQSPAVPLPPRQRPVPAVPQQHNKVDPQLLSQWTNPGANQPQGQPQQQFHASPFQLQQQQQQLSQIQQRGMQLNSQQQQVLPPSAASATPQRSPVNQFSVIQSQFMQSPSIQPGSFGSPVVQVQQTGLSPRSPMSQFATAQPQTVQSTGAQNVTFNSSPVQQQRFMQPQQQSAIIQQIPLNTALPSALVPSNVTVQPQPTGQSMASTASSRSWASATPDNPFGGASIQQHHPPQQQGSFTGIPSLQSGQTFAPVTHNVAGNFQGSPLVGFNPAQATDPNDRYSAFKSVNNSSPSVFNTSQQPQQVMVAFQQPQATGFVPMQQQQQQQQQQQPFGNQQQFYNRW